MIDKTEKNVMIIEDIDSDCPNPTCGYRIYVNHGDWTEAICTIDLDKHVK